MTTGDERPEELHELQKILVQSWNVLAPRGGDLTRGSVHDSLVDRVRFLLKHDFDKLIAALYLLDVPETRFNEAMAAEGLEGKAGALADAIWDRELEKLHLRRRYKHEHSIETTYEVRDIDEENPV